MFDSSFARLNCVCFVAVVVVGVVVGVGSVLCAYTSLNVVMCNANQFKYLLGLLVIVLVFVYSWNDLDFTVT